MQAPSSSLSDAHVCAHACSCARFHSWAGEDEGDLAAVQHHPQRRSIPQRRGSWPPSIALATHGVSLPVPINPSLARE